MPFTEIAQVGERGLIEMIGSLVELEPEDSSLSEGLIKGISDDTAVYRPTPGSVQLFTTDTMVEGVDFDLTYTSFKHLGWKAMISSMSDIGAMGGRPRYAVVAIAVPRKISVEMVREVYEGAVAACREYRCLIVGGDTSASVGNVSINVAMVGEAEEAHVCYRSGAKIGDLICVTGDLGASQAGLKVLLKEKERFLKSGNGGGFQPNLLPYKEAIEKHFMPRPRVMTAEMILQRTAIHAMIDISDGLASDLRQICARSRVGAEIEQRNIPIASTARKVAQEFSESPIDYALYGGEEYELLFTLSQEQYQKLEGLGSPISVIGSIVQQSKGVEMVAENADRVALPWGGWDHFRLGESRRRAQE
ncbi:MAG: thiamine-phosphate kinase [Bacteroidota bacterium]